MGAGASTDVNAVVLASSLEELTQAFTDCSKESRARVAEALSELDDMNQGSSADSVVRSVEVSFVSGENVSIDNVPSDQSAVRYILYQLLQVKPLAGPKVYKLVDRGRLLSPEDALNFEARLSAVVSKELNLGFYCDGGDRMINISISPCHSEDADANWSKVLSGESFLALLNSDENEWKLDQRFAERGHKASRAMWMAFSSFFSDVEEVKIETLQDHFLEALADGHFIALETY
eukprot:TRINITY_DN19711_c0_g1_i1.p1 TRINITY_DN19711_c0_g1~~TRINITY_DN19711_c0_g1_i1.p1  ORF type:complete len:234 (+),score=41.88 TRINITY_DN19711_c0_g1_i1:86-787(+)